MKMKTIRRIAAGILASAIVLTGVPEIAMSINPVITAQAAKKKKAGFSVSPKKLTMNDKDKTYTIRIKGVPKKDFLTKLNVFWDDNLELLTFTNTKATFKPKRNSAGTITIKYGKKKKAVKYTINDPSLITEEEKNYKKLVDFVKANGKKDEYGTLYAYGLGKGDFSPSLMITYYKDKQVDSVNISYTVYDPETEIDRYASTSVESFGMLDYAQAYSTDSNTGESRYDIITKNFEMPAYKAGQSLNYTTPDKKMTPITDASVISEADASIAAMYTGFDKFLKEKLGFGVKDLGMTNFE